jgi:hypothetical protein
MKLDIPTEKRAKFTEKAFKPEAQPTEGRIESIGY